MPENKKMIGIREKKRRKEKKRKEKKREEKKNERKEKKEKKREEKGVIAARSVRLHPGLPRS